MKIKYPPIIIIIYLMINFFSTDAYSFTYYVSSTGNDLNTGLSEQFPWRTITKVNLIIPTMVLGGQILFKRGDKFVGSINITLLGLSNELIFGAYGSGNLPIITGKKSITGWTQHSPNIYKANISESISHLYVSNKLMNIARYPNSGFLRIDEGNGANGFYDEALNQPSGYWNGATCRVRSINWIYEVKTVTSFSNGNIGFSDPTIVGLTQNYGYYLDNKYTLLDTAGEWYHDINTGTVYLYSPGINPVSLTVEGTVFDKGFNFALSVVKVKIMDLNISGYKMHGIDAPTNFNITIRNCLINHTGIFAIRLNGWDNIIDNNRLEDNYNVAIMGVLTRTTISNNIIKRTWINSRVWNQRMGLFGNANPNERSDHS